jgi:chemotaxis protein CheD
MGSPSVKPELAGRAPAAEAFSRRYYYDPLFRTHAVRVNPGEYHATTKNIALVTLLGSCVSVCLRDPETKVGGMNHFLLPGYPGGRDDLAETAYGEVAIDALTRRLVSMGASSGRFVAKVFGGARLYGDSIVDVGKRNADFVLAALHARGVPILHQDLYATNPRRLYFFPATGDCYVKIVPNGIHGEDPMLGGRK